MEQGHPENRLITGCPVLLTADKRRAVEMLLSDEEWSAKSDRWIAETAGVHHSTVQAIKQVAESANPVISGSVIPKTGMDGKIRLIQKKPPSQKVLVADYHCAECRNTFTEVEGECPRCYPAEPDTRIY